MEKISMKKVSIIPFVFVIIGIIFSLYYFLLGNWDIIELFFVISFIIFVGAVLYSVIWGFLLKRNLLLYGKTKESRLRTLLNIIVFLFMGISFLLFIITEILDPNERLNLSPKLVLFSIVFGVGLIYSVIYFII